MEFGKQGQYIKNIWQKWNTTIKLAASALIVFFVYAQIRTSMSLALSDRSQEAVKKVAASPSVGLKGKPTLKTVQDFVRSGKKELNDQKQLSQVQNINSALDIIQKISTKFPSKEEVKIDVKRLLIQNDIVTLEGEVTQRVHVDKIKSQLLALALDKKINEMSPSITPSAGKKGFAFNFKVDRRSK